ncbi:MAG: ABC transporter permease subunit [Pseudomonadota bacterium]
MAADHPSEPHRGRRVWIDLAVLVGLIALIFAAIDVSAEWKRPLRHAVNLDLSPWALPEYTLYSLARGWFAYALSLLFTLGYASWAYYDPRARRILLPVLDVLQSIPVLGFLPGLVLALVHIFPHSNIGLEFACVVMIFTAQAWNMTFSYYDSLQAIPSDYLALGRLYGFRWWHRFWKIELPFGAQGLLYNSMVSMAGGWFFLTVNEAFQLGNQDFRLPGVGSYMSVAIQQGNVPAQISAVIAMAVMIITVDRLVWWPLVVWSRKFKLDDFGGSPAEPSPIALWLARSRISQKLISSGQKLFRRFVAPSPSRPEPVDAKPEKSAPARWLYYLFLAVVVLLLAQGLVRLALLLRQVDFHEWLEIIGDASVSFIRVLAAAALGAAWAIPAGVWIGLNPGMARRLQPFIQFAASFPAPMVYPLILFVVLAIGGSLQWGAVLLILFGTQWYILFNVAASAAAIPNEVLSASDIMQLRGWRKWRKLLLPAVFPGLLTGLITAVGGAWNATIVSEYIHVKDHLYQATGLGALISRATDEGNFPKLAAAVLVMAVAVVGLNRTLWKRLQTIANERCRFGT